VSEKHGITWTEYSTTQVFTTIKMTNDVYVHGPT